MGDYWALKIDSTANIIWQTSLGGSDWDSYPSVALTADGGFLLSGSTLSNDFDVSGNHGMADIWVVKLDSLGNMMWQRSYGGSSDDGCLDIINSSDGCFLIAGRTDSNDGDVTDNQGGAQGWIIKIDSVGNIVWQKCLGANGNDAVYSVSELSNKTILVTGQTNFAPGVPGNHGFNDDAWVVLLDSVVTTGMKEQNSPIHLRVYPNPAKDHLTVSGLNSIPGTISIYDTDGTCLLSQKVTSTPQSLQINLDKFSSGMYYIKFESNQHVPLMKKFVVAH